MNIWTLAKRKYDDNIVKAAEREQKLDDSQSQNKSTDSYLAEVRRRHESHIIFCGSRKSGKSSFQLNFVERRDDLKESVGLEYSYARRTRGNVKDIANLWELGGGHKVVNLLSIPLNATTIDISSIIILVDLTKVDELWLTIEMIVNEVEKIVNNCTKTNSQIKARVQENVRIRISKYEEADKKVVHPCPLPLLIVGSKYDEFQNFESEKRRNICLFLRFLAHFYGAHLMMYSSKMEQLTKLVKNMTSHFAFDTVCPQGYMIDHNRPLFVKCGNDNFQDIGAPPSSDSFVRASTPFELWKDAFNSLYPYKEIEGEETSHPDPLTDPLFKEPTIDNLVIMKRRELEIIVRQNRDRQAAEARAADKIAKINF